MKKVFKTMAFTLLGLVLSSNLMAITTSDLSQSAATTIEDGAQYVVATAYNGTYLTTAVSSSWGTASTIVSNAGIYTAHGSGTGFYLTCSEGTLTPATSKTFSAYGESTSSNLSISESGELQNLSNTSWKLRLNTNFRWYSSATGSAVYLFKINAASKTLSSIAISGTPKTAYETGESFDVTGLTVTGTYDDASTADLTNDAEWTINPATFTSTSQTSVSVTATIGEKSDTKQYNVSVTEHVVTPGTYEISLNNALYGISTGNNGTEQSVTTKDITVVSGCASDATTKPNYYATHIRYYAKSYLKLSVPAGYEITSVVFTESSSDKKWDGSITSTPDSYNADTKTWTGKSQNVDFAFGAQNRAASIKVTYAEKKVVSSIAVKTAPTKTTYYVSDDFDPAGLVITASYTDESTEDIAYTEDNKDAFSFSGFSSAAPATNQEITVTYAEKSATFNVDIQAARVLNSIEVASNPAKMVYEVGEALDLTGLVVNGIFSKGDPEPVEYTADPEDGTTLDATGTTTVTLTSVDNTELTTSFDVTVNAIEGDRITLAETGVSSGGSYAEWTGKTGSEGVAVYAGKSAGGNSSIQLNTSNPQGIVSTTSGGLIRKVKVDWNSSTSTTGNRSIDIYGSNTAYTGSGDIYNNEKQGTKLGSIVCGTSTELEISGDYEYVGVRAIGGALYMNSITFVWSAPKVLESIAVKTAPTTVNYAAGEFFNPAGLVITATYDDESTEDITYEDNEDKFSFSPALDAALATTNEKVTITYGGKSCDQTITVKNIELTSIVVSGDLSKTDYTEGDDFDFTGLVATGYYSDESHKTITEQVVWSIDPATLTAGQTSVSVIATMNEISGNKSYDITVAAAPLEVTWDASQQSYENQQAVTEATFNAIISAEFEGGKYYTTGTAVRVYGGKTFAIHAASGYKITSIVIGFGTGEDSNAITADCGTYSNGTWTGSAKDVTFTVGGTSGNRRLKTFTVTYAVAAPSAVTPTITPSTETETYWEPITVTLATTTAEAAIYYTTDGTDPTTASALYEGAFQVSNTTTVKAIAVKDGLDNSEVATKTFTFGPIYANLVDLVNAGEPTTTGKTVKVTLTNEEIAAFDGTQGIYIDVPTDPVKRIEVYCKNRPEAWVVGGTVSGTLQCTWKKYSSTWELCPTSWTELTYNAPAGTTEVVLTGTPTKNVYVDGEAFDPAGITVTATINGVPTVVTEGITWSVETLTLGTTSIDITATYNNVVSNTIENFAVTVTAIQESTIADFITNKGGRCYLIGTVSDFNSSTKRFNLTDETGTLYIYSHSLATGIAEVADGEYIKVLAETYNPTYENAENVIVVEKPSVAVTGVSLDKENAEVQQGQSLTLVATITPEGASNKKLTWSIINDNANGKISVDQDGKVTVDEEAVPEATATVQVETEDGHYTDACVITVKEYKAVKFGRYYGAITEGDYVITAIYQESEGAMNNSVSSSRLGITGVTPSEDYIVDPDAAIIWHITAADGDSWTISNVNGYAAATGTKSQVQLQAVADKDSKAIWDITAKEDDVYDIESVYNRSLSTPVNSWLRRNQNTGWACYASSTGPSVKLYKKDFKAKAVLVSIAISGDLTKKDYFVDQKILPAGLTVTGTYSDNSQEIITEGITWSIDPESFSEKTESGSVNIKATVDGKESNTITINDIVVTEKPNVHTYGYFDFTTNGPDIDFSTGWGSSYAKHVVTAEEATVTFASASKQTGTITNMPVSKGDDVVLHLTEEDKQIASVCLTTEQWGTNTHTITIEVSYDGTNYTELTGVSGDETNGIQTNISDIAITYVKFKFSGTKQIGIESLTFTTENIPYVTLRDGQNLENGKMYSFCSPYDLICVKGAIFYQPDYMDAAYVHFVEAKEIKAGIGYILEGLGGELKAIQVGDPVSKAVEADEENTRGMQGVLKDDANYDIGGENEGYQFTETSYSQALVSNNHLQYVGKDNVIVVGRAYLDLNIIANLGKIEENVRPGARRVAINFGGQAPTNLNGLNDNVKAAKVLRDGQLYIIRDAKTYNAQGIEL